VEEKGFSEERVDSIKKRLRACLAIKPQMSLESYFGRPKKVEGAEKSGDKKKAPPKVSGKKNKK
jgi:hypothetical protein